MNFPSSVFNLNGYTISTLFTTFRVLYSPLYQAAMQAYLLNQAYKFDLFSTTCVSRLVEPLSFFLEFCHKAGNFEELIEFLSKKIEFIEGSIVFLYENAMDFW